MDVWIWNDAVFNFELYQDRDGAVHRLAAGGEAPVLERVWPAPGERQTISRKDLTVGYERLSGAQTI